jgi:outer membrane lipoprotein-sorting protein
MHCVIFILLFAMSTITFSQENGNAGALLQEVVSAARRAETWRAEGIKSGETTINDAEQRQEVRFKIAVQGAARMRWETSGADQTTVVCDGTDHWTFYRQPGGGFYRSPISVSPCGSGIDVGDFLKLTDGLLSATVIGRDHVQFAGALRECDLVRAEYEYTVSGSRMSPRRVVHTFCVDHSNKMILRDRMEVSGGEGNTSIRMTETTTYLSYERNIALPPDTFRFVVPKGAIELKGP